jgi:acetoin utilization protein AcuB
LLNREHTAAGVPYLLLQDTVQKALDWMQEHHLRHLPIVEEDLYIGLIEEDDLLQADEAATMESLRQAFSQVRVLADSHVTEAARRANEFNLTAIPVTEPDGHWVGLICLPELLRYFGQLNGLEQPGGLIVLEMERRSFSFSEISKLIETNDAQITQLNTFFDNNLSLLIVTIRINKFEISDIVATFQRYEYRVKYYFGEELYENELRNNFDHLMNYLNI